MSMDHLRRTLMQHSGEIWVMDPRRQPLMLAMTGAWHRNEPIRDEMVAAAVGASDIEMGSALAPVTEARGEPKIIAGPRGGKATALVSMRGVALYDFEFQPYAFSTALFAQRMKSLGDDPDIGMIVVDCDTPGGLYTGTPEARDAVDYAVQKRGKRVVFVVNPLCASAGLLIATGASEIIAVPTAYVGSLGVYQLHWDDSEFYKSMGMKPEYIVSKKSPHKVETSFLLPMSDETREYLQKEVDEICESFIRYVARGRKVQKPKVESDFGQGRAMFAAKARSVGMIDAVMTIDSAMSRLGVVSRPRETHSAAETPEIEAEAETVETEALDDDVEADQTPPDSDDRSVGADIVELAPESGQGAPETEAEEDAAADDLDTTAESDEPEPEDDDAPAAEPEVSARRRRLKLHAAR